MNRSVRAVSHPLMGRMGEFLLLSPVLFILTIWRTNGTDLD
jgi:hypothetical protein|tara:strand:+ start:9399 stop:9521 length:123 start_codon:yes stop_codon:yes gene_type:complete